MLRSRYTDRVNVWLNNVVRHARKRARSYLAQPSLQGAYRLLYRIALAGMNYGGAGSNASAGDSVALRLLAASPRGPKIVFDIGANVGAYTEQVLRIVGSDVTIIAFEPSRTAFEALRARFRDRANVELHHRGMGARCGTATLWSSVPGSVLGSTFRDAAADANVQGELIEMVSLDEFCAERGIEHIHLLKVDVEGGELDVLRGASRLLAADAIDFVQFEFGQPSLGARSFFGDLYRLLDPQFEIFRVLPNGLEPLGRYHETLEVFMSTNYVAIARRLGHYRPSQLCEKSSTVHET